MTSRYRAMGAALVISALSLPLAACGKKEQESDQSQGTTTAPTALPGPEAAPVNESASAGPPAFAVCATCHSTKPGENMIGPSLFGVVGRKAGTEPGFDYSPAMKALGMTWDEDSIDRFIEDPPADVPGTKMPFAGLKEEAKRKEVIAYLETLK